MNDLYAETAPLFTGRFLHGGCDEVNWGGGEQSRKMLESKSRSEIWGDYDRMTEARLGSASMSSFVRNSGWRRLHSGLRELPKDSPRLHLLLTTAVAC